MCPSLRQRGRDEQSYITYDYLALDSTKDVSHATSHTHTTVGRACHCSDGLHSVCHHSTAHYWPNTIVGLMAIINTERGQRHCESISTSKHSPCASEDTATSQCSEPADPILTIKPGASKPGAQEKLFVNYNHSKYVLGSGSETATVFKISQHQELLLPQHSQPQNHTPPAAERTTRRFFLDA